MKNQGRVKETNLSKYLYPPRNEYERERPVQNSPILAKQFSYSRNDFATNKPNLRLYYRYDDQQDSPSSESFILNKELNRNALGNAKDENQFSVLDNNYSTPLSYTNKSYKPTEGRVYHYSIASRKDYSRDKEEDYNLYYYYPEQKSRKYYIEKKATTPYNEKNYFNRKQYQNILPTKVYISDSYMMNKNDTYKFRPSREKDGYKGGIVNLKRKKNWTSYEINSIILIQRWWRNILNEKDFRNDYQRHYRTECECQNRYQNYPSLTGKKVISRGNEKITEKIIPGENDKFIVQTTRVEVIKRPYMCKPLLKPEIIYKDIKPFNIQKNKNFESNKDFEIILDKETLKQHMRNIWNEENISTSAESLNIIQNESDKESQINITNITRMKKITINEYEEQIKQLKIDLSIKEKALIEANNKIKSLSNKRIIETDINNLNFQDVKYENYLKKEDIAILGMQKPFDENLKIQVVDKLFIKNKPSLNINTESYKRLLFNKLNQRENIVENTYNFEIIPIEKEPLKKQLVDSLYIEAGQNKSINEIYPDKIEVDIKEKLYGKKIQEKIIRFENEKTSIEANDSLQILPIEKEALKKQLVDNLYIEGNYSIKPENKIQNVDSLHIFKTARPENIIDAGENLEILPVEKMPLKKQLIDALYIEGLELTKTQNVIQNVDKLSIMRTPRALNVMEIKDNIEIDPMEREPLKKQLVDDLYIERLNSIKPENKIQNIDKLSIFKTPRPENIIEPNDNLEILPIAKEPLKKQIIDSLQIEGLSLIKPENKIQNIYKLTILKTAKPENIIEIKDFLEILPTQKEPLQKQLVDDLYIESLKTTKPVNKIQCTDQLTIFKSQKPLNIIETGDIIQILPKQKDPLQKQVVDSLYIEKLQQTKPLNKIQNIDKISLFTIQRPLNLIELNENIEILPIEKEPLKKQLTDSLYVEGAKYLPTFKNLTMVNGDELEILKKKEQILLLKQVVDSIYVEGVPKIDNEIQQTSLMTILKTERSPNVIESMKDLFISSKEKEQLKCQIIDKLLIEGNNKDVNEIQNVDKLEILKSPKKLENVIEEKDNIVLLANEREALKNQIVDKLLIEGNMIPDNKIQIVDKIEILRKPRDENIIEAKESLYIPPKDKELYQNQNVDKILIEANNRENNLVQNVEKMIILKTPKPENIIEENDNIFIPSNEKEPLQKQLVDDLFIETRKFNSKH